MKRSRYRIWYDASTPRQSLPRPDAELECEVEDIKAALADLCFDAACSDNGSFLAEAWDHGIKVLIHDEVRDTWTVYSMVPDITFVCEAIFEEEEQ